MHNILKLARTELLPSTRVAKTFSLTAGLLACGMLPAPGRAQTASAAPAFELSGSATAVEAALPAAGAALPDSPGFSTSAAATEPAFGGQSSITRAQNAPQASSLAKTIEPGQIAPRLTIGDKVLIGIRENASVTAVAGWLISAGYEQATDGSPNYGQTGKGFAQRLGAAAARGSSENIFSDSVIAPILHQDPRYYRMGPGHNFVKRLVYAGTRGLITRTDGGRTTINFSNLGGDLGGSALTQLYYPPLNRSFTQVMQTWGGSIGGDAVGYVVSEFFPRGLLHVGHAK